MAIQKNTKNLLKKLGLPFSPVINSTMDLINDPATLGVFVYLSSKPDNWVIQETELMRRFDKGRDYIRKRLKELKDVGLLETKSTRDNKGHITGWTTMLYSHILPEIKIDGAPTPTIIAVTPSKKKATTSTESPHSGKARHLEKTTYTNKRDLSLVKKETTTTGVEVFVSETIDHELIELRNEHMPDDERDAIEFIKQCQWHLDTGDKKKYNFSQRLAGLKKLIRNKCFETPATYPSTKKKITVSEDWMRNSYDKYYHSWVEQDLRNKGYTSKTFEEWKRQG